MRRWLAVLVLLLIAGAYVGGWWPERAKRKAAEADLLEVSSRIEAAEGQLRLVEIENQLLLLVAAVEGHNYGTATTKASRFFDAVRIEAVTLPASRKAIAEGILAHRETVTTALADPEHLDLPRVRVALDEMREAMTALRAAGR
jgi:hypothetical protein